MTRPRRRRVGEIARALEQAGESGQYHYQTTIAQTTHPTLNVENVGRTARTEYFELEGEVDVPAARMSLQLTAANNPPLHVKLEDGMGYGRLSEDDPWTEVEIATDLFAPGGDPMGFLAAAENVRIADGTDANDSLPLSILPVEMSESIIRYQFDLSGPKYAKMMRDELEDQMRRQGELPAGITLQLAQQYVDMTGSGEIWVRRDALGRDLPMRQALQLEFPVREGANEWIDAEIVTSFSGWAESPQETIVYHWGTDFAGSASALAGSFFDRLPVDDVQQAGFTGGTMLLLMGLSVLIIVNRRRQVVRVAVYSSVIASMLVVPLLQAQQVSAFYDGQLARQVRGPETGCDGCHGNSPAAEATAESLSASPWRCLLRLWPRRLQSNRLSSHLRVSSRPRATVTATV